MIETAESRAQFEKRRAKAIAAFKHAVKGELPLDVEVKQTGQVYKHLDVVGTDGCKTVSVELPLEISPEAAHLTADHVAQLTEAIKGRAEAEQRVAQHESKRKQRKRDKYWWREYRKRPKTCPHCGKEI